MSSEDRLCLALDFGGTKLAAGLVNLDGGTLVTHVRAPTPVGGGAAGSLRTMFQLGDAALQGLAGRPLHGAGVSFGGPVDAATGTVLRSLHVAGWDQVPLASLVSGHFGVVARMDNDANAAALGEWRFGVGRGSRCMAYYTLSTGVGGGIILGGTLFHGATGVAGELGHVIVDRNGPPCPCGNRGCVEALCSGPAIARRAREAVAQSSLPTLLRDVGGGEASFTAATVAAAASQGDAVALAVWREVADDLAVGMGNVVNVLNLDRIVIGGGVAQAGTLLLEPLRAALPRYVFPAAYEPLDVRLSCFGGTSGLYGAAALLL